MFCRWFIWCLALVVLGGDVVACADQKSKKVAVNGKSELIAAKYGYTVVEDVPSAKCEISGFEMVSFLNDGESFVKDKVMRERAVTLKANFGLVDAKRMLDNQEEIPAEFQGKYLVFPGTLLRDSDGRLHIAFLCWVGDRWHLHFHWVGGGFYDHDRLVRCKSSVL